MDEPTKSNPEAETETDAAPEPDAAEAATDTAGEPGPDSMWTGGEDFARIAELEAENAYVKDRLLRLAADMENLRRRTAREVSDAKLYAVTAFARDILTVGDNLQRTIGAVTIEEGEEGDSRLKSLLEGVEMTERDLVNVLARHGITRVDPKGERFDPNVHEAVVQMPDPSVPAGLVAVVMQPGYMIGERVLRPAMVGVTAGGPRLEAAGAAKPDEQGKPTAQTDPDSPPEPGSTVDRTA